MSAKDVIELWDDDYSVWSQWFEYAQEDYNIVTGNQWAMVNTQNMGNRPKLSINIVKKSVDLLSGHERQNRTDIKAFPIEGSDESISDIYTQLFKWILSVRGYVNNRSLAFYDSLICGLGWLHPYISFENDVINGDIMVKREDPFKIMIDPYTSELDLSDCGHILRRAYISKEAAKKNWPDRERDIDRIAGNQEIDSAYFRRQYGQTDDKLNIIEKWYRETVEKIYLVDLATQEKLPFDGNEKQAFEIIRQAGEDRVGIVKRQASKIKLKTVAEDDLVLYDGDNPQGTSKYPFIPIWGFFTPSHADWEWKVQGIVRSVKDLQIEKNKRRSQLMEVAMSMPSGIVTILEDSRLTIEEIKRAGPKIYKVQSHDEIMEHERRAIDIAFLELEKMFTEDINTVGQNPDLLGLAQGGSGANAPGVTLQLRQRQGLTSVQTIFDNLGYANKSLGNYLIELVNIHYKLPKVQKIIGENAPYVKELKQMQQQYEMIAQQAAVNPKAVQQVQQMEQQIQLLQVQMNQYWQAFEDSRMTAVYDCKVDEITASPTYRLAIAGQLADLAHQGQPIPLELIMEYMGLPKQVVEKYQQHIERMRQMQMQAQQSQQQFELGKEQMKKEYDLKQAMINVAGKGVQQ